METHLGMQDGCSAACAQGCTAEAAGGPSFVSSLGVSIIFSLHPCRGRMLLASAVVVWEWLNEHGRWRPYSPAVCHHIEAVIRSDPRCGSVVLGQVDSRLSPYIIDLHSMHQFRQDTGEDREERRKEML